MIQVTQDEFGEFGNCMSACLASILEIPLKSVPNFTRLNEPRGNWWKAFHNFLGEHGIRPTVYYVGAGNPPLDFDNLPPGLKELDILPFYLHSGPSPRGWGHATVGWRGEMIFDPHPSRAGILKLEDYTLLIRIDKNEQIG